MSFLNASQNIQLYVSKYGNVSRTYTAINAILDASRANTKVRFADSGLITNGAGKLRQLKVTYFPIQCGFTDNCSTNLCSPGTKVQPKQINFKLQQCSSTPVYELDRTDIRFIDGYHSFSEVALSIIASALPQWRRNFAISMLTLLAGNMGTHLDGNATHQVTPSLSTTGQINPVGKFDIEREFLDGGFEPPFMIGGLDVYNWIRGVQIGGENQLGQNIAKLDSSSMYYDDNLLAGVLGDMANGGHIIAFDAQVLKFVSFSENSGQFATQLQSPEQIDQLFYEGNQSYIYGVMVDPITGVMLDFYAKFDPCGGTDSKGAWTFQLKYQWDIFFLPEVACNDVQTVNGIMHFRTCPHVVMPCPSGTADPSPVASKTWSNTPGAIYPLYIHDIIVAGAASQPNVNVANIADLVSVLNDAAPGGYVFTVSGSNIHYTGYSGISVIINGGNITLTFA